MKRLKKVVLSFTSLVMASGIVMASGCEFLEQLPLLSSGQSSSSTSAAHECESECVECGKCLDETCTENVCKEKCEGHETMYKLTWNLENVSATLENGDELPLQVTVGDAISFVVTEDSGYANLSVKANGVSLSSWNGVYSIEVDSNATFDLTASVISSGGGQGGRPNQNNQNRKSYSFTDATVTLKDEKPYYVLKGTYSGYTVAEMQAFYFDMQNYNDFNDVYGWTTTVVDYDVLLCENQFEMYVDLSEFPLETCIIPHFNETGGNGDIKVNTSDGVSVKVGEVTYMLDFGATPYSVAAVTIMSSNGFVSAPSDTTPPTINTIVNHEYFQTTEIPVISINTDGGIAIDDESLVLGEKVPGTPVLEYDYIDAKVSVANCAGYEMTDTVAKVKVRGNYSSTYPKRPIRIKFDKKQKMCGLNGGEKFKNWVLFAEYKDSSMLRNSVAFYLGNTLLESDGLYCTDFRYVEVYLNGVYNGLYLLVEQQEVKEERIDLPEAIDPEEEPDNPEATSVKIGYSVEFDGYYYSEDDLVNFTLDYDRIKYESGAWVTPSQTGYTINSDIYFTEQRDFLKKCMQNIWDIVYNATYEAHTDLTANPYYTLNADGDKVADPTIKTPREAVEKVIDVRSLVDMFILNEICENMDIGWSSFYMSLDMSEGGDRLLRFEAPWDFDSSLGSAVADNTKFISINKLSHNSGEVGTNPWLAVLCREAWFWTHVQAKWNALEEAGTFTAVLGMIDYFSTNYADAYKKNFDKWPGSIGCKIEGQQINQVADFKTEAQAAAYLKTWLTERIENLGNLIDAKVESFTTA